MEGGDDIQGTQVLHSRSRESTPSDVATSLAPEPASIRAPYQGEDSRVTLLRNFDDKLQEWVAPFFAGKFVEQEGQPDNHITISIEMARFYQLTTRGAIPRTTFLESEYDQLKVKNSALEKKELEWDKSNSNLQEQLDAGERGCTAQGEVTIEMCAERIIAIEMMQNSIPPKEDGKFTLKHPDRWSPEASNFLEVTSWGTLNEIRKRRFLTGDSCHRLGTYRRALQQHSSSEEAISWTEEAVSKGVLKTLLGLDTRSNLGFDYRWRSANHKQYRTC
ncbi:hypothetical protein BKA65DRAFT_559574 [Rhexocercosporidium sp. MPI-PUGE-AT-0058]|nr:hypothetical protein BKA65DRAFT_559574 [Rhexocercosporidium sp. MPI-PUGE-AT-0058]